GRLDALAALADDAPPSKLGFYCADAAAAAPPAPAGALESLASRVRSGDAGLTALVRDWLHGCFVADSVEQALARRAELPAGAKFVVPQGHCVSRHAVQFFALESEQEGVLVRQHELENLNREHRALELLADDARTQSARIEAAAAERMSRLTQEREALAQAARRVSSLRVDAERLAQQLERASHNRQRIESELAEIAQSAAAREAELAVAGDQVEQLDVELAEQQEAVEQARARAEEAERRLADARESARRLEREQQEADFAARSIDARVATLNESIAQGRQLAEQAAGERDSLQSRLEQLSDETARSALQQALAQRVQAEQQLSEARQRLDELTRELRELEEQRLEHERAQEPLRQQVVDLQLKEQAAQLAVEQFGEQLREAAVDCDALRAQYDNDPLPKPSWLAGEVTRLANAIAALGAVNLAALDELAAARERKTFLDAQSADLNQAIETLEDAIRRIDRETRTLLQDTYDTVNRHFGELFPVLFGGGEARLVLTGDEILDAGVQVVAQPPGKRNASIHLLSGGEKALTAIALVFSLFQLNPAPFCLLDEVDAPLDDANTERYCDMVRRMSEQTQFVFITHNKIAMEMAQQLVGVTMQERGVSRIVAVDLEAAAGFAEAA
ncbi:MAG TPA: chromosome segregation protein SMC, partial [Burkholderiaceae bacterium]|nr:chromosome segregation protein SMC [Burkholderiaceae bacterium]